MLKHALTVYLDKIRASAATAKNPAHPRLLKHVQESRTHGKTAAERRLLVSRLSMLVDRVKDDVAVGQGLLQDPRAFIRTLSPGISELDISTWERYVSSPEVTPQIESHQDLVRIAEGVVVNMLEGVQEFEIDVSAHERSEAEAAVKARAVQLSLLLEVEREGLAKAKGEEERRQVAKAKKVSACASL